MNAQAFFATLFGLLVVTGCGTAHVTSATGSPAALQNVAISVKEFDASQAVFKGSTDDVGVLENKDRRRISTIIALAMIERLTNSGFSARLFSTNDAAGNLVVDGVVTSVEKGSFAKRLLIGGGAGAPSIKATVKLYHVGTPSVPVADLKVESKNKAFSGGIYSRIYSNDDWIGIYSAGMGYKIADAVIGKLK